MVYENRKGIIVMHYKTKTYLYRIQKFINKHKHKLLSMNNRYVTLQGKDAAIRLYYSGLVSAHNFRLKFKFDENKIEEFL